LSAASIKIEGYARAVRIAAATTLAVVLVAGAACGGESTVSHQRYLYAQKCASCHGVSAAAQTPVTEAPNLLAGSYTVEQVRRAVIDGRKGMPKGLLGGKDVDQIADYIAHHGEGGG
jgi:mono/diheme cytochrome c family protein